jgi:hypothetical protein
MKENVGMESDPRSGIEAPRAIEAHDIGLLPGSFPLLHAAKVHKRIVLGGVKKHDVVRR